jgi:probable type II restriction enzyme, methylase subunit
VTSHELSRQEEHLLAVLSGERFLKMEGLSNEIPFFIYPYEPEHALDVTRGKTALCFAQEPAPRYTPSVDNVLPFVNGNWFEGGIVARFPQLLRVTFGEKHFGENLRFVEESLGVKSLREYFITRAGWMRFYDDHVKPCKKCPICWLFSSSKGSFNALIFMHRYTPSTVLIVLNEYLREFIAKLEANLQRQEHVAAGDSTLRVKAAALKEAERLRKILLELSEYKHDVLYPLASQQIAINLNDGVLVNCLHFGKALAKIPEIEKKCAEVETWPTYPLTLQDGIR